MRSGEDFAVCAASSASLAVREVPVEDCAGRVGRRWLLAGVFSAIVLGLGGFGGGADEEGESDLAGLAAVRLRSAAGFAGRGGAGFRALSRSTAD